MNEEDTIDLPLQDYVDYLRTKRGSCPTEERLSVFQKGGLAADEAAAVQAHVDLCDPCQTGIKLLARFELCAGTDIEEIPDWPEVEQRGQDRFQAFLKSQAKKESVVESKPSYLGRVKSLLLRPAFAYLVILALLYPAYRGLFHKPEIVKEPVKEQPTVVEVEKSVPAPSIATARIFNLRLAERGVGQSHPVVRLSAEESFFVLSFLVPASELPEFVYDIEVRDSGGRVVTGLQRVRPQDQLGRFAVSCNRELFSPGRYELRVKEMNKTTQSLRGAFAFHFVVEQAR